MNYAKQFMDEKGLIPKNTLSLPSTRESYERENQHKVYETPQEKSLDFSSHKAGYSDFKQDIERNIENRNQEIHQAQNQVQKDRQAMKKSIQDAQGKSVAKNAVLKGKKELEETIQDGKNLLFGESQKK
jgi:hypothetical protein